MDRLLAIVGMASLLGLGGGIAAAAPPPVVVTAPQGPHPITRAAFLGNVETRFSQIDANHDGQLNNAELTAQLARELQRNKAAVAAQFAAMFKRLDTNKDGQLSFAEFSVAAPQVKSAETPDQLIQMLDTNHDGKISADEFRAPEIAKFNRADTNHDGIVTPAEARAAAGQK